jgi:hypothetical protein
LADQPGQVPCVHQVMYGKGKFYAGICWRRLLCKCFVTDNASAY